MDKEIDNYVKLFKDVNDMISFKKNYDGELRDGERIPFFVENYEGDASYVYSPGQPAMIDESFYLKKDGIEYVNQVNLEYLNKIKRGEKVMIYNENKIVYPCFKINLLFDYPMNDSVAFECESDDKKGFTCKELLEKVLKYYRLIQTIHYNYNFDDGTFTESVTSDAKLFRCCMGDYLYNINITGLQYKKETNQWVVNYDDYV